MNADVIASIVTGVLVLIGIIGIIVPVLPGTITVIAGLLVWAIVVGGQVGWTVFAIGAAFCLVGMVSTYLLTGRVLKREKIPNRSIVIGLFCGVIGIFVIPVVGLLVGFVGGLFASEYQRMGDAGKAWRTSWQAIKATGAGVLVEFFCAAAAIITWVVGLFLHF
ncbi:hypothetical protein CGZ93_08115 [Enemella dayhoffiae]|uniref:DUF456 domain-containing protein n=1 Tax=Enemella dayhoffiae TaxID=2016507 RepID=A0A255H2W0_9ACTN|nr:DUF456 domain-containing protein [Enemella dayhoffiae]OYO21897.1 hypothetical protein CGZ93_08115 [Enemella dayhoffiae]